MEKFLPSIAFALAVGVCAAVPASANAADCVAPGEAVFADAFDGPGGSARFVAAGGDDAHDGSYGSPWATIQHAVDTIVPGDVACVRGGTYRERVTITRSGLPSARLALRATAGETATIDGTGLSIPGGQYGLVTLIDASHIEVRGLEIANYATASAAEVPIGLYITGAGTDLRIVDNHIHDIRTTASGCAANAFGLKVDGTRAPASINALTISRNEIDHLVLGCSESFSLDGNVERWTIDHNRVHDTNNIGIGAIGFEDVAPDPAYDKARDGTIVANTVYAITSFGNPAYGEQYAADGIYVDGGTRITIEANVVHHVDLGIELASEHAGRATSAVTVRNNVVYAGQSAGLSIGGYGAEAGGTVDCTLVGNTLYHNDTAQTGSGEIQIQYHADGNVFANNVVAAGAQGVLVNAYTGDTAAPATFDDELYHGASAGGWVWQGVGYDSLAAFRAASGQDVHAREGDPAFVDTVAPDLHVRAGSPAIDGGTDLGPLVVGTTDADGAPRVQGASIDIGAYEYR